MRLPQVCVYSCAYTYINSQVSRLPSYLLQLTLGMPYIS